MAESKEESSAVASPLAVLQDAMAEQAFMARTGQSEITIRHDPKQLAAMREAHAALAELIEADKEYDAAELSGHCIRRGEAAMRRRAALARVGGAE